jgi:large subunit ribosomal protein L24
MAAKIKKGDKVVVVTGANKGTVGTVTRVMPEFDKLVVEGVNRVKRHTRPTPQNPEGGILQKDMPIHRSNVMLVDPKDEKPTRVRMQQNAEGKKVRVAVKSGTVLDG